MNKAPLFFIILALLALMIGALLGILAGVQYVSPGFLKDIMAYNRIRPLHVTTVIGWIILCATGGVYYYLIHDLKLKLFSRPLLGAHLVIFTLSLAAIYVSISTGLMGGREYLTYAPIISVPILLGWILFGINYFKTVFNKVKNWPVYLWMWGTGIVFMIYHFSEAHLWLFPFFRENFVRDLSVQWKSYGSFIGSWNMLVYGTAIYLITRIKNVEDGGRGKKVFFFYFLGLVNLMFGWAHHTYIVPMEPWIRYVAYAISMTEWIILLSIIRDWKRSLGTTTKTLHKFSYKFLLATDFWVMFNVFMAILISIPFLNFFTHGTHVTVAHSMGTTIGINTTILLASVLYISSGRTHELLNRYSKSIMYGYWIFNVSLLVFLGCLYAGGISRGIWTYFNSEDVSFAQMHEGLSPVWYIFLLSGFGLLVGILGVGIPLIRTLAAKTNNDIPQKSL